MLLLLIYDLRILQKECAVIQKYQFSAQHELIIEAYNILKSSEQIKNTKSLNFVFM